MDIISMLEREPFYEILCKTMISYYKEVGGEEIIFCERGTKDTEELFLYYIPTFISRRMPTKAMKKFLYSEYNIRGSFIKYVAGKAGVFLITHSFGFAAKKHFYIYGKHVLPKELFISPCNRTVRFYYFERGYVDCIVKEGYSNAYMQNQLRFRMEHQYVFIPRIAAYGDRWYREEIMYGHALIRERDEKLYLDGQRLALEYMKKIAEDSFLQVEAAEYLEGLRKEVQELLTSMNVERESEMRSVFTQLFKFMTSILPETPWQVPTAVTHGDLQGGNIWINRRGEIIIYDWETNKRRTLWFDPATLLWGLHSTPFSLNLEALVNSDSRFLVNDRVKEYDSKKRRWIAWILFLENLIFYLEDIAQLPVDYGNKQLEKLMDKIVKYIGEKGLYAER